ncbi:molecular chaperone Hsp33 [Rubricella aquisinus]|uniref:Molecular chaperone Hsp33 n=1 Tax=Rubricella aquisinus TaxID=2028108 RepID=A0A840WGK6_9RHOB|nr:Hsp33 family molecular chaperone HslO [Rubricella aquisinus]MBB5514269.1 molecular chaperone Hsp33 [Rubricella aquisinus]
MTSADTMAWDDIILPFQLDKSDMRGRVARLDDTLEQILTQHDYPMPVAALVAEAAMLTALIGQTIKLRWKLSLQIRGEGAVRLIATDYYAPEKDGAPARIRAYAGYDEDTLDLNAEPFSLFGKGYFGIIIDQGQGMRPYQGITPLAGGSLASCAEAYFAQSEQLPTRFAIASAQSQMTGEDAPRWRGGGVMLQHMPPAGEHVAQTEDGGDDTGLMRAEDLMDETVQENWTRVNTLLETVELTELVGPHVAPDRLLLRLFHEEGPRVYDPQTVEFGCTCSEEKVRQSLSIYSAKDIGTMTTEEGTVTADCQFCGAHYVLDPATVGFESDPSQG